MALVQDPDFNIMQQSHGLLAIAKLLVVILAPDIKLQTYLLTYLLMTEAESPTH